jgi:hypothetical protein
VYKTVADNWWQIQRQPANREWVGTVRIPSSFSSSSPSCQVSLSYSYSVGLYDDYGDRVSNRDSSLGITMNGFFNYYGSLNYNEFQVMAQHKYYEDSRFQEISFTVPLDKVTDNMISKIDRIYKITGYNWSVDTYEFSSIMRMTVAEWQKWLTGQGYIRDAFFPSGFMGTWKRDNFNNTLTFSTDYLKASNQPNGWNLLNVSGDSYSYTQSDNSENKQRTTMKIINGNLEISGDSGTGEDNWNGTWKKQRQFEDKG